LGSIDKSVKAKSIEKNGKEKNKISFFVFLELKQGLNKRKQSIWYTINFTIVRYFNL